jgi:sugar O-acyltransferase (sialic acid O-acetyltransferase NeuD family)
VTETKDVLVPQLGVNDEKVVVVKWMVNEGDYVSIGDQLCIIETTKATYDVEAGYSGYITLLVNELDETQFGQTLAVIGVTVEDVQNYKKFNHRKLVLDEEFNKTHMKYTRKAINLANEFDIQLEDITPHVGGIIKESDVVKYIEKKENSKKDIDKEISIPEKYVPVVIYGAGKGGFTILETLALNEHYRAVCFVDDNIKNIGFFNGLPVFKESELPRLQENGILHVATEIMRGEVRLRIKKKIERLGLELINVIHPNTFISPSVTIGNGNFIKAGSVIETNTVIGDCCIIDNGVIIAHDNKIEDGCHIAPGAVFGSNITLGYCTVVGIGASISTNINIGEKCIISVGSSVTKDIGDNSVVDGVPSKIIGSTK